MNLKDAILQAKRWAGMGEPGPQIRVTDEIALALLNLAEEVRVMAEDKEKFEATYANGWSPTIAGMAAVESALARLAEAMGTKEGA